MLAVIQNFLQMMFAYKQSFYYRVHLFAIFALGVVLVYILKEERRLKKIEEERPLSKCTNKTPYFDYVTNKLKTTREAVQKLEESKEYKQYLREKENPNSRYNMYKDDDDISDIVLSDDSSEEDRKRR